MNVTAITWNGNAYVTASSNGGALLATLETPPAVGVVPVVPFAPAVIVSVSPGVTAKLL
jgi:hypothetical protein